MRKADPCCHPPLVQQICLIASHFHSEGYRENPTRGSGGRGCRGFLACEHRTTQRDSCLLRLCHARGKSLHCVFGRCGITYRQVTSCHWLCVPPTLSSIAREPVATNVVPPCGCTCTALRGCGQTQASCTSCVCKPYLTYPYVP